MEKLSGIVSYFWQSNEPDPITGLTPREKNLVTSSYNIIKKDLEGSGIKLFMILFERKPEYQDYFPFRDIPREKLPKSPKFKAHSITVMYSISSIIENLYNSEVLVQVLQRLGDSHAKRDTPRESFTVVKEVLLDLVKQSLGSKINQEGLDAWKKTLNVAFKVIDDTMKEGMGE